MTTNTPDVVSALDTLFTRRNTATGWLWYALLRLLAHGEPVTIPELAAASNRTNDEVAHAVRELRDTEYDQHGRIVGYGITLNPTPHRFTVNGRQLYTWCALDTLILPVILDQTAHVESLCPTTGRPVRATVEPVQVTDVTPATAVVSIVIGCDLASVRASFCNHVHFFTDTTAAQPWLYEHPGGSVLPVGNAYQLGRRLNLARGGTPERGVCC